MTPIKKGYKQTDIGIIPEDWEVVKLKEFGRISSGGTPNTNNDSYWNNGEINWCTPTDITALAGRRFIEESNVKITELGLNKSSAQLLPPNSLLVCTRATIGKAAITKNHFSTNQGFKNIEIARDFNVDYIYYQIVFGENRMLMLGTGSTFFEVSKTQFDNFQISLPSDLFEQSDIAEVLSGIDSLIEALDKKIAKKRVIKEGTMQQLLTGKKRLSGFSGEWVEKKLGEILTIRYGKSQTNILDNYGIYPIIGTGGIVGFTNQFLYDNPSIIIGRKGSIDKPQYVDKPFWTIDTAFYTEIKKEYEVKYLYYKFCCVDWYSYNEASGVPSLNANTIENISVIIPTYEEQSAIAQILTDMDNEIEQLEKKRQKYIALKQGTMQKLLTGQIRLTSVIQTQLSKKPQKQANIHFKRSVWAAEIADRLCDEPTFGHVKMEKLIFLTEHICGVEIGSNYHRDAAGPYDNRAIRSIDSQLKKQNWFEVVRRDMGYRYIPLTKRGGHKDYFDKYYSDVQTTFDKVINTFRSWNTERCEIVATLYSAWKDLANAKQQYTDNDIINEVLNNWNDSKKRIPEERWQKALNWMRENGFTPIKI